MRDDDNRRNKYSMEKQPTCCAIPTAWRWPIALKLKPSIFRSSGLGIIAATQLREIPSPRLANAQVDSFKDDNSVDSTELGPVRMSVLKLRDWIKRLPQNLTPGTLCGRSILVTLLPHDAATDPKLQKRN